jgi:hypothetical protein
MKLRLSLKKLDIGELQRAAPARLAPSQGRRGSSPILSITIAPPRLLLLL